MRGIGHHQTVKKRRSSPRSFRSPQQVNGFLINKQVCLAKNKISCSLTIQNRLFQLVSLVGSFPRSWNQSRSKITLFQGGAWVLGLKTAIGGPSSGRSSPAHTSP